MAAVTSSLLRRYQRSVDYSPVRLAESLGLDVAIPAGHGYLSGAGEDGVTKVEGVPASAEVIILDRASGLEVDRFDSAPDGTWSRERLDMSREFDLVFRKDGYNDGLLSAVTPADAPRLTIAGTFLLSSDASQLTGTLTVSGGTGPYSVDVVEGKAPVGISFSMAASTLFANGRCQLDGSYSWTLKVTDIPSGRYQTRQITMANMVSPDLAWASNTNIILPNDADFGDLIQASPWSAYETYATPTIDSSVPAMGRSLRFVSASQQCLGSPNTDMAFTAAANTEMTVEFWFYNTANLGVTTNMVAFYNDTVSWFFYWYSGNKVATWNDTNGRYLEGKTTLALNTRYHYAWVRDASGDRLYLNGKLEASSGQRVACPASRIILGATGVITSGQFFDGFIQGLRISRVARYRNNFTPPQTYKAA